MCSQQHLKVVITLDSRLGDRNYVGIFILMLDRILSGEGLLLPALLIMTVVYFRIVATILFSVFTTLFYGLFTRERTFVECKGWFIIAYRKSSVALRCEHLN